MDSQDEVLGLFIEESREHLDGIEGDLLQIEQDGADIDPELVNRVFRAMHTIKGGAGFFALDKVKQLAHAMENILDQVRNRELVPTSGRVSILLEASDVLLGMINDIQHSQEREISPILEKLSHVSQEEKNGVATASSSPAPAEPPPLLVRHPSDQRLLFEVPQQELRKAQHGSHGGIHVFLLEFDLMGDIQRKGRTPWELIQSLDQTLYLLDTLVDTAAVGLLEEPKEMRIPFLVLCCTPLERDLIESFVELPPERIHAIDIQDSQTESALPQASDSSAPSAPLSPTAAVAQAETPSVAPSPSPAPTPTPAPAPETKGASEPRPSSAAGEQSIRVHLDLLDRLMSLAGELVLTRNELLLSTKALDAEQTTAAAQRVDAITSQLQEAIMATRMQTVGIVFSKFRRIVRDLGSKLQKQIRLEISGEEVDLDRTIVEAIGDPLTHLVRNAVDHGIEPPDQRLKAGKPAEGLLRLDARHEAGQVIIEISDDGAGIDPARIKRKALEKGLLPADELDRMSPKELIRLIFRAGFSTAEKVTEISGRGVGMDVVLQNLSRVGGVVDLDSTPGKGTLVRIKLPLTLAIIPSVLVSLEGERFAIPQVNLAELVRVPPQEVRNRIDQIGDVIVLRLRGELLPLVRLKDALELAPTFVHPESGERVPDRRERLLDRRASDEQQEQEILEKRGKDRRTRRRSSTNIVVVSAVGYFRQDVEEMSGRSVL
ncbi:MAG TPA: chemotaxis protein CheA, partial [Kiritimatiellia bacterium]|nr:chemotaxis protein CheA [Kiritimatiellia bacterium]